MKKYNIIFVFLGSIFFINFPADAVKTVKELSEEIEEIRSEVAKVGKAYGVESVDKLKQLSKKFDTINCLEELWLGFSEEEKVRMGASQTGKQAVGASLFFPAYLNIEEIKDFPNLSYFLERNDIIWSLAIAAKYNDLRGTYYLNHFLSRIWNAYNEEEEQPDFYNQLNIITRNLLIENSRKGDFIDEASYIIGYEYIVPVKSLTGFDLSKGEQYLAAVSASEGASAEKRARSELLLLDMKTKYRKYYEKTPTPTFIDYQKIKETHNFPKAVFFGSKLLSKDKVEESLKEIAEKYPYIYVELGNKEKLAHNFDKAAEYYKSAGSKGISFGYIKLGILELGMDVATKDESKVASHLENFEKKEIKNIIEASFLKAEKQGDPIAWHYNFCLYQGLHNLYKKDKYVSLMKDKIIEGLNVGSPVAYNLLPSLYEDKEITSLISKYGKAPHVDLWQDIKDFCEGN